MGLKTRFNRFLNIVTFGHLGTPKGPSDFFKDCRRIEEWGLELDAFLQKWVAANPGRRLGDATEDPSWPPLNLPSGRSLAAR